MARFLRLYRPTPYLAGCSQAVWARNGESVLIFPEGTRFSPEKRRRALEKLASEDPSLAEAAGDLTHVLPPKPGGVLALFDALPGVDCVVLAHSGLERFSKIQYIADYLKTKRQEIESWNKDHNVEPSDPLNARRLTNVGIFRAYIVAYLRHHPMINQEMTFLVRHLDPTVSGLPIEIYVFSRDQEWGNYESIQADVFDHLLAVAPEFGLAAFQSPSGSDFAELVGGEG